MEQSKGKIEPLNGKGGFLSNPSNRQKAEGSYFTHHISELTAAVESYIPMFYFPSDFILRNDLFHFLGQVFHTEWFLDESVAPSRQDFTSLPVDGVSA